MVAGSLGAGLLLGMNLGPRRTFAVIAVREIASAAAVCLIAALARRRGRFGEVEIRRLADL